MDTFVSFATVALNVIVTGHRGEEPGTGELVKGVLDFICVISRIKEDNMKIICTL